MATALSIHLQKKGNKPANRLMYDTSFHTQNEICFFLANGGTEDKSCQDTTARHIYLNIIIVYLFEHVKIRK